MISANAQKIDVSSKIIGVTRAKCEINRAGVAVIK
jgi:hypothetical protein